jgi:hypothetical protein
MNKVLLIAIIVMVLLGACTKKGQDVKFSGVDNYEVQFLFEVEGVRVFRFRDNNYNHYLAIGGSIITKRTINSGKSSVTTYPDVIVPQEGK